MAPSRPSAVVSGTEQNDCTPFSISREMTAGKRCLESDVVDDERLLCLPYEAAGRPVDGEVLSLAGLSIQQAR